MNKFIDLSSVAVAAVMFVSVLVLSMAAIMAKIYFDCRKAEKAEREWLAQQERAEAIRRMGR